MGSSYDSEDQPRMVWMGSASGSWGHYVERPSNNRMVFTDAVTNAIPIEPPKPAAELTDLLNRVSELVDNDPTLANQFNDFLDKYTDELEIDLDIG